MPRQLIPFSGGGRQFVILVQSADSPQNNEKQRTTTGSDRQEAPRSDAVSSILPQVGAPASIDLR